MRQSLELKLGQRLTMTPQLQQAIRLLQLSAAELQVEIREALESNPLLEEGEEAAPEEGARVNGSETPAARDEAADWEPPYDFTPAPGGRTGSGGLDQPFELDARTSRPLTLRDHLLWQLQMTPLSATDQAIAQALIEAINDDGYLTCSLEDIRQALGSDLQVEPEEVEAVLHQIQNFDPLGVGARDLGECLALQLKALDPQDPAVALAGRLVADHLQLLANRDFNQLRRALRCDQAALQAAVQLVQGLNPRPGGVIQPAQPDYVIPDVLVRKHRGRWHVALNESAYPRVDINQTYARMIRREADSEANRYLQEHLQEARWFLKSLRNRHETLLKVARAIVERQKEFLEQGEEAMKPLVLHDIAEELGLHESTISRVTTQKYMLTPRGILELKYFFSSHVGTADGGTRSATAIRSMIRKLIEQEPPTRPISDSKIVEILARRGIQVARRTVAKYREHMNIPPSNQRKSIV